MSITKQKLIIHLNRLSPNKLANDYAYIMSSDLDRALWHAKDKEFRKRITERLANEILASKNKEIYLQEVGYITGTIKTKTMSTKKTTPKRLTAKKLCSAVIVKEGLKKDGTLKKGYRYAEGGKIVKAQPVRKASTKKKTAPKKKI